MVTRVGYILLQFNYCIIMRNVVAYSMIKKDNNMNDIMVRNFGTGLWGVSNVNILSNENLYLESPQRLTTTGDFKLTSIKNVNTSSCQSKSPNRTTHNYKYYTTLNISLMWK